MPRQQGSWGWFKALTKEEKAAVAAHCERFIEETLKPRFLPEIGPTQVNYPVDLIGFPDNTGEEFNSAFARLDFVEGRTGASRFDVMWLRHTGQWFRLHAAVTLDEALHLVETDGRLHPYI